MGYMLGLSTVSFLGALDTTLDAKIQLLDFAYEIGLDWVEIRDSTATLTPEEGLKIADHAKSLGLEVGYAIQAGLLDSNFQEVLSRGLETARQFSEYGPGTFRILGSNDDFSSESSKIFWTDNELDKICLIAKAAAGKCRDAGLKLVVENAVESFLGNGEDQRGFSDLLDSTPEVGWQFDTANVFSASRRPPGIRELLKFLHRNGHRLSYLHLKSSVDSEPQPVLTDNPLPFLEILSAIESTNVKYLCIELTQDSDLKTCFANHRLSLETLKNIGIR